MCLAVLQTNKCHVECNLTNNDHATRVLLKNIYQLRYSIFGIKNWKNM